MATRHKILILDDEQDLLDLYQEFLSRLPDQPEIHTAASGQRALAMLESEPFSLLLTDLNMPTMDGFQVLTIVRRKFPSLRTVVMTAAGDDQFRTRAYGMGIDLYLEKPKTNQEIAHFNDCIESLLNREEQGGFRGVQSKSLADIIQMECLSTASMVLKITNGPVVGKIYIHNGDLIDAEAADFKGEEAFKKIMGWKSGSFESLPGEPARERTIFNSYQGLLLDSAQSLDEAAGGEAAAAADGTPAAPVSKVAALSKFTGVEFVIINDSADAKKFEHWSAENAELTAAWSQKTLAAFHALGEKLKAGRLNQIEALGSQRHAVLISHADKDLCVGFQRSLAAEQLRETTKQIVAKWVS